MASNGYYSGNPFGNDDSFLWNQFSENGPGDPPTGNPNYSGNPFDPYSSVGTENTYIPGQGAPTDPPIPVNDDPNVIGSSTYDPLAGATPNNNLPLNLNDGLNMGGGMPGGSGGGIFGGNNSVPIPVPGISWPVAIGADILMNNGNLGGGSGPPSLGGVATNVGNVVTNPGGTLTNLGNSIMGPQGLNAGAAAVPIAFPSSTGGGLPPTVSPPTGQDTTKAPVTPISFPSSNNNPNPINPGTDEPKTTIAPPLPPSQPPGPAPSNPVMENQEPPATLVSPTITPPGPAPTNPTQSDNNGGGSTTVIPTGGGGGTTTTNPVITPTVPIDTSVASPLDRNFYNEGNQTTSDLQRLLGGIAGLYGNASGAAGQTDFTNWQNILSQFGAQNQNLTGQANAQTQAANTALRTNNLNDVQSLLGQATNIRNQANPGLLGDTGSLQNYSNGAASFLQQAQQQQNDANFLSPQEMNTAQQSARNAWSARGLVNSPGAVGAEILNTDAALRGRQQQAFQNTGSALGAYGQAVNAQQQGQFDPFNAILGSQYGNQTNNAGSNSNLYGQSSAFSSGAQGDQYAQGISNPFQPYAQDVYNSNFNGANARNISASNNAAAVAGANTAQSSALANSFLRLFGQYMSGSCWVARSIFGVDDPRWMQFRYWMLNIGPTWFRKLYLKHGEKFALWLDRNPWLKPKIKELMEARIKTLSPKDRALSLIEVSRPEIRPIIVALAYGRHLNLKGGY